MSDVSEVSELSSHREIIAHIGARVQNLRFMTFRGLDRLSYFPQKHFGSNMVKVCQATKNSLRQ